MLESKLFTEYMSLLCYFFLFFVLESSFRSDTFSCGGRDSVCNRSALISFRDGEIRRKHDYKRNNCNKQVNEEKRPSLEDKN